MGERISINSNEQRLQNEDISTDNCACRDCEESTEDISTGGNVIVDECCGTEKTLRNFDLHPLEPWWRDKELLPSAIAGIFLLLGYVFEWAHISTVPVIFHLIALTAGAWTFVPGALKALRNRRVGVALLITIAAIGAVALGHVGEAAALAFLFSLSESLEDRAMDRAQFGLHSLLELVPDKVKVLREDIEQTVSTKNLLVGDVLIVAAGGRVATDGSVVSGQSSLDTSAVTGESIPVDILPGAAVLAGSINVGGTTLHVLAEADGADNSLTQIVALVEQAQSKKGKRARLADRIAKPLVPLILGVSLLIVLYGVIVGDPLVWLDRALVVLVAASPCALAIAVPVTVISAIGSASKFGVIIKSGQAFEQLGSIRTIAFDKTGTLTKNQPRVIAVEQVGSMDLSTMISLAASAESTSTHPLAVAIMEAAEEWPTPSSVTEIAGMGVAAEVDGQIVKVGNSRWLSLMNHLAEAEEMASQGMTVVVVYVNGFLAGIIGIRDELRAEAAETVLKLDQMNIDSVMITGDNLQTAKVIAEKAGIADVKAEQLPIDKAKAVAELTKQKPTAMVGDGINDAPALATATVGIAMGLTGSDAAIDSAEVVFTGNDLRLIPAVLEHAKRGRRIMVANIALSLAIIIGLFPLALFGVLGLAGVVFVHEVAEVIVILNGTRAARKPRMNV